MFYDGRGGEREREGEEKKKNPAAKKKIQHQKYFQEKL